MKIKLEKQGTTVIVRAAAGDIDPATNSVITTMSELENFYKNIGKELQKKPGYKWFNEINELKNSFSGYSDYGFYENNIRYAIIESLGLKKRADGCFISFSYTNIDDFSQALEKGCEWLLANKNSIKENLQNELNQEDMKIKGEFLDLIDLGVLDDESDLIIQETLSDKPDIMHRELSSSELDNKDVIENEVAYPKSKKRGCCC